MNASGAQGFDLAAVGKFDLRISALNLFDRSYGLRAGSGIGVGAPQFGPPAERLPGVEQAVHLLN